MRKLIKASMYGIIAMLTLALMSGIIGPFIYWKGLDSASLNIWVVDKTVPLPDYREHKGLMWVLDHFKIINEKTGDVFRYDKDYFGFFPVGNDTYDTIGIPGTKEKPDLIYFTDTYGVYTDDFLIPNVKGTRSELIYGGLNSDELNSVRLNLGNGNTVIGEFNIASSPTNGENRRELGRIFGIKWTGWKGRYFKDLTKDIEVPSWMVENYEKQYGKIWGHQDSGFVLVSDDEKIVVLEEGKEVGRKDLKIKFNGDYSEEFGVKGEIPYYYWFEFTKSLYGRETLANFKLDVTEEGKKVLEMHGLSPEFPAAVRNKNTQYTSYYFAGDFADVSNTSRLYNFYGLDVIKRMTVSHNKGDQEYFFWKCYVPLMKKIVDDVKKNNASKVLVHDKSKDSSLPARAVDKGFQVIKDGKFEDMFIKGVNLGPALPGKWFTEFPEDEETYVRWFEMIGNMNANSIRIYTLLPPEFYSALGYYNSLHAHSPLYIFQEIWPEENPEGHDYLKDEYVKAYNKEIEYAIDAIHGVANIPQRKGRAYGIYTMDVSDYVLGYLVGRELEPDEVITTNVNNSGFKYKGDYLSAEEGASPSEAWLAMNCDYVLKYEESNYNSQHPVAIVSWPTLDPSEHDSEWNVYGDKSKEYNDKVSVDIKNFAMGSKMKAGFFGAYHIYPNYPDFMNNEPKYESYSDEEGRLRYGGYLKEFMEGHKKYPALVAEFGLATGMGNAHTSPDGYNHGGLTEEQQGDGIVRMMKAIEREGYAGGLIFEWMDEWAKKTWITEPYMIPYDRHVFWHNGIDPEQNYGILAFDSKKDVNSQYSMNGSGDIKKLSMFHDSTYLYMDITLGKKLDFSSQKLLIGLDTYGKDKGEFKFGSGISVLSKTGLEFLLDFTGQEGSKILVHPGYNISKGRYASYPSSSGIFEEIKILINNSKVAKDGRKTETLYQDGSRLNYGKFEGNSHNHWYMEDNTIHVRIPWGRINFADPSSLRVLDDESVILSPVQDELKTSKTDGILASALLVQAKTGDQIDILSTEAPYTWKEWEAPVYTERLKKSYDIIKDYFNNVK